MTGDVRLLHGDCLDVLRADQLGYPHALGYHPPAIPDASVDVVVTDPPYGLADHHPRAIAAALAAWLTGDREHVPDGRGFMGREWDRFVPPPAVWDECLRVLKPGGWLLAFAGSRTADLMGMSVRLAGFEVRDGIDWLYGSGFPKSLDVSKAIDKAAGAQREVVGYDSSRARPNRKYEAGAIGNIGGSGKVSDRTDNGATLTAPATDDASRWAGWGTALKPAREPIVVARKPLAGTVAATVLAYGTGALNIDDCRVGTDGGTRGAARGPQGDVYGDGLNGAFGEPVPGLGRWPSNVVLSHSPWCEVCECGARGPHDETPHCYAGDVDCLPGCPVAELDAQSGITKSSGGAGARSGRLGYHGGVDGANLGGNAGGLGDTGGASRFFPVFRYQAKAPARERPKVGGVAHPTVKPVALMRWLVRLVCPPGGVVLDPFAGSGTTGEACRAEGFACVLIEREADYLPLIESRIARHTQAALL